jgi:methylmalonyl-CoA mutase cobalamin-binding subunit
LQPPELETFDELRRRPGGIVRVIVAGATGSSGSARIAAMLSEALTLAGLENGSIQVVNAGATLSGVDAASAAGAWRFVVVTGVSASTLTAAFAMVKAIETRHPGARIELLITGHDTSRAHAAYLRVRSAAERFLGRDVGFAGAFAEMETAPADESDDADSTRRRATRVSRPARMWAARLLAECSEGAWPEATHSMN